AAKSGVRIEIIQNYDHRPSRMYGDRNLLQQVLMNICVNALHAMADGGSLLIEVKPEDQYRNGRAFVGLRVSDSGQGIAPDSLAHVFDPFFTTKEVGEGTGLGLSVARRIVEEHGGWIEVANREVGGAAFTVWLPEVENDQSDRRNADLASAPSIAR